MRILVTGSEGMIGSHLVRELINRGHFVIGIDINPTKMQFDNYKYIIANLGNTDSIKNIVESESIDRIIHLAALAHSMDGKEYSWEDYYYLNVKCAQNVFNAAKEIPVLFISTVDVFGFTKGKVSINTEVHPVSNYAKSKALAEYECKKIDKYDIYRLSPVYTEAIKRDIQKRYYLKYPMIAYQIGKGTEYEVLNVKIAVEEMVKWCNCEPKCGIRIIKDKERLKTIDCIKSEKEQGRARYVVHIPKCFVDCGYMILKGITGENKYTYLLNKAVYPIRSE